mgnify:CR=1 FL=1
MIEKRLSELLPTRDETLLEAARYSLLSPGKRLRPHLAMAANAALDGDPSAVLDPACAIEMIHAYMPRYDLDRLGIIELRPLNRYRLKLAKTFRWRPHGPVMDFFREHALLDYYSGGFDGHGESLLLVHGSIVWLSDDDVETPRPTPARVFPRVAVPTRLTETRLDFGEAA